MCAVGLIAPWIAPSSKLTPKFIYFVQNSNVVVINLDAECPKTIVLPYIILLSQHTLTNTHIDGYSVDHIQPA